MERREIIWLGAITAVGAIARFATLDLQGFHHDEAVTAGRVIGPDLFETLGWVKDSERSPPLYYVLAWPWAKLFGTGEVGLRSLSALIGTLTIPAAFFAGRELGSKRAGLVTAALVALSPMLIWYSQEARSYALFVLFSTLALAFFARSLSEPSRRSLWLWAAMSALALLSHYFAVFLIGPQILWLLYRTPPDRRRTLLAAAAAVVAVGLALLPLARAQEGEGRSNSFAERPLSTRALEVGVDAFAGEEPNPFVGERAVDLVQAGGLAAGALGLLAAAALLAGSGTRREREGAALAGGVAATAILVPLGLALFGLDFANPRNMIGGYVPVLLVLGIGFSAERRARLGLAAAAVLCAVFVGVVAAANSLEKMQRDDWRSVAEALDPAEGRRILVINHNGDDPIQLYLGAEKFEGKRYEDGVRTREIVAASSYPAIKPPDGWDLAWEDKVSTFYVRVFRVPKAELVRPGDYSDERLLTEQSEVLIDRPG